jgi:Receptor family ligand binding region
MKHFGWKRVSIIHSREEIHAVTTTAFQVLCKENNITVEAVENFFPGQPATDTEPATGYQDHFVAVDGLRRKEAAIIVMAAYQEDARVVLDYALQQGMVGNQTGFVWMGTETWVNIPFWEIANPLTNVMDDTTELQEAVYAIFGPTIFPGEGAAYDEFARRMVDDYSATLPLQVRVLRVLSVRWSLFSLSNSTPLFLLLLLLLLLFCKTHFHATCCHLLLCLWTLSLLLLIRVNLCLCVDVVGCCHLFAISLARSCNVEFCCGGL